MYESVCKEKVCWFMFLCVLQKTPGPQVHDTDPAEALGQAGRQGQQAVCGTQPKPNISSSKFINSGCMPLFTLFVLVLHRLSEHCSFQDTSAWLLGHYHFWMDMPALLSPANVPFSFFQEFTCHIFLCVHGVKVMPQISCCHSKDQQVINKKGLCCPQEQDRC